MLLTSCNGKNRKMWTRLQVRIVLIWKGHIGSILHLLCVLLKKSVVDLSSGGSKCGGGNEFKSCVTHELSCQPQEGLLKVVVGLCGDVVVLEVLLSVECDSLGLHLSLLNIDFVSSKDDWDILADTDQVTVPVGNVLVRNTGSDIEHDNTALPINVVSITKASELLLSCSIPDIELDVAQVRAESKRMNFNTECRNVLLLELSSQMTLDECGLSSSSITDKHELESGDA